jgi:hypothetical protein
MKRKRKFRELENLLLPCPTGFIYQIPDAELEAIRNDNADCLDFILSKYTVQFNLNHYPMNNIIKFDAVQCLKLIFQGQYLIADINQTVSELFIKSIQYNAIQ